MAPTLQRCPACSREVSTQAASCPHCGQPFLRRTQPPTAGGQLAVVGAVLVVAILTANLLGRGCERNKYSPPDTLPPRAGSYESLIAVERSSCDAVATQAERFARGRESGMSLETHLTAAAVACKERPDSNAACKTFPELARRVHAEKWTAADAAERVKEDCRSWIYK